MSTIADGPASTRNFTWNSTRATRKKKDMPVCSSELYAGRARKNGTCLFPVPNSTRAFFLSRHALRRRPISRPTWHSATARRLRLRTLGRRGTRLSPASLSAGAGCPTAAAPPTCARHLRSAAARRAGSASAARCRASQRNPAPAKPRPGSAPANRPWCRR